MTLTKSRVFSDPALWARYMMQIQAVDGAIVPFVYNRSQADYMSKRTNRDIIVKARQLGMSTGIQGELARIVCTSPAHVITLADVDTNTQKLRRIFKRFFDHWPDGIPRPIRGEDSAVITTFPELNSSATIETAGSRSAGRAGTYRAMHASEVAYWTNPENAIAGALQAVPYDGWAVLESTANGAQGWFYETAMGALAGKNNWTVHFYPWWWEPRYAVALDMPVNEFTASYTPEERHLVDTYGLAPEQVYWRRLKQSELLHLFPQEFPESVQGAFLQSGNGYFGDITGALYMPAPDYHEDMRTFAGLDFGQTNDYTVLSVGDAVSGRQVEVYRVNRLPWHDILSRCLDRCEHWHVSQLLVEWNSIGGPNFEIIRRMAYERGIRIGISAFKTTAKSKPSILSALHSALHTGALSLLDTPETRQEFQGFQASQSASGAWKYEAGAGGHDDIVMATALMYHAMARPTAGLIEL